jgi:hypothetical protein
MKFYEYIYKIELYDKSSIYSNNRSEAIHIPKDDNIY